VAGWGSVPPPFTVEAIGVDTAEPVRCGTRRPCPHGRGCRRVVPELAPVQLYVDDLVGRLADASVRPVVLGRQVRLMKDEGIAAWEELTGRALSSHVPGQPGSRGLTPSGESPCTRPVPALLLARDRAGRGSPRPGVQGAPAPPAPAPGPSALPPLLPGRAGDYWPGAVPGGPVRECGVPGCTQPSRLYPCGWRCDGHAPGPAVIRLLEP
jgi:hypothetical protein